MISTEIQERMIELRRVGKSFPEISKLTGISKTTVWRYVHLVSIEPQFISNWRGKRGLNTERAVMAWENAWQEARSKMVAVGIEDNFLILVCLYWAEGSKREFTFTNSDPAMIKMVCNCLYSIGVERERLIVSIRIYSDMVSRKNEIRAYWAKLIGVNIDNIKQFSVLDGRKEGKLRYGVCRVRIKKGGEFFKLIMSAIDYLKYLK